MPCSLLPFLDLLELKWRPTSCLALRIDTNAYGDPDLLTSALKVLAAARIITLYS